MLVVKVTILRSQIIKTASSNRDIVIILVPSTVTFHILFCQWIDTLRIVRKKNIIPLYTFLSMLPKSKNHLDLLLLLLMLLLNFLTKCYSNTLDLSVMKGNHLIVALSSVSSQYHILSLENK